MGTDWPCFLTVYAFCIVCIDGHFYFMYLESSLARSKNIKLSRVKFIIQEVSIGRTKRETSDDIPTSCCANGGAGAQCDFNNMSLDFNGRKALCGM